MTIQQDLNHEPIKMKDYDQSNQIIQKAEALVKNANDYKKCFKKMLKIEKNICTNSFETGYIFDSNGQQVWMQQGGSNYVDISDAARKGLLKGNILTHNHPRGTSFSLEDIQVLIRHELSAIRAVGSTYQHSMKVNHQAFQKFTTAQEKYNIVKALYDKYNSEVRSDFTDKIQKGKMTVDFAEQNHQHEVWTRVINESNLLIYERKKWND